MDDINIMATANLNEIENEFARMSPEDQLKLLERLVHRARIAVTGRHDNWDDSLSAMAADPDIQCELRRIDADFSTF